MDIHDTLHEATSLLEAGRQRAFGAGVVVDRERLLQLLQHAQQSLPEEILAGASILAQRTQIMSTAEDEAEQIRSGAQEQAEQIRSAALADAEEVREAARAEAGTVVARAQQDREALIVDHDVLLEAQQRAADVLERAQRQAGAMRAEVDSYVDAKLAAIATTLGRTLDTVEAGRRKVRANAEDVEDEIVLS